MDKCQALLQQAAAVPEEPQPKKRQRLLKKSDGNMGEIHGRLSVFWWFHMFHGIVMGYDFFTNCMVSNLEF